MRNSSHCVVWVFCSSDRQLLLCGMYSGFIRVYPLQPGDHSLASMQAYWTLGVHDNQYGHLRHIHCSHDDQFVLTAGDDGNIFSFSLLPPEELQKHSQRKRAKVPSPRVRPHFILHIYLSHVHIFTFIHNICVCCIYSACIKCIFMCMYIYKQT